MRISMCSCLQWLLGVLCNPCSGLTCGPPGDRGESWLPHYIMLQGIHKSLMLSLAAGFRHQATEQSMAVIPGMYGVHCKHSSSIQPLISNNPLALLGYGSMCTGTLDHIARYPSKTSNNNNALIVDLLYDSIYSCFLYLLVDIPYIVPSYLYSSLSHLAVPIYCLYVLILGFAYSDSETWNEVEPSTEDQEYLSEQADLF